MRGAEQLWVKERGSTAPANKRKKKEEKGVEKYGIV
jgi:hypothetical protein